jgi:phage/plasmid primase-like uncharacterized protein
VGDRIKTWHLTEGRWPQILPALGIPSKALNGRHQPCLFCGGKDRARFTDHKGKGSYFCNQCGSYDGFRFLMKFHGWTFIETCRQIDTFLGKSAMGSMSPATYRQAARDDLYQIPKSTKDCALWLRRYRPKEELDEFLERHHPEVRWWLSTQEAPK